jgi:Fe-S oxidoreductase
MNRDAQRLKDSSFMLSDFLEQKAAHFELPRLSARAIVQGHCHHQAVLGMDAERNVLRKMGLELEVLDSGCCGMAGSFGFEAEHDRYEVSMRIGERVLLPRVRAAGKSTLILADGFSCRHQISQGTGRRALHLAQVLRRALASSR